MGEDWDELEKIAKSSTPDKGPGSPKHHRATSKNFQTFIQSARLTNKRRPHWKNQLNAWKSHRKKREKTDVDK